MLYISVFRTAAQTSLGLPMLEAAVAVGVSSTLGPVMPGSSDGTSKKSYTVRMISTVNCFIHWSEGGGEDAKSDGTQGRYCSAGVAEYWSIHEDMRVTVIEA